MMSPSVEELPFHPATAEIFGSLAALPWAVWLDSGRPGCASARWDILACDPRMTLVTRGPVTEIRGESTVLSQEDPLALLGRQLGGIHDPHETLPFCGGALGWLGYDLGRCFERLPETAEDRQGLPEMMVGIYDWALLVDHATQRTWLAGRDGGSPRARRLLADAAVSPRPAPRGHFGVHGEMQTSLSEEDYLERFARVQSYIESGDCYQVNLTRRFSVTARGDPWTAYLELRRRNPAPFGAFLNTPPMRVMSASPERFLRVCAGEVETTPIKGTIRRVPDLEADLLQREALADSAKDRAENLMIVDLLRNDLGRGCAVGSIQVPSLFQLESFADVHHLVSRITGRLAGGVDALGLLRGCFPGGSVTGAPKIRAMEIIEELEDERRSVYCGSIGYIGYDGGMDTSIAIRTMIHARDELCFWAGGGIVADSRAASEAAEIDIKAQAMRDVAEAFRVDRVAGLPQLARVRGR
jgi:para-aminobenzoate synthetase component 1